MRDWGGMEAEHSGDGRHGNTRAALLCEQTDDGDSQQWPSAHFNREQRGVVTVEL